MKSMIVLVDHTLPVPRSMSEIEEAVKRGNAEIVSEEVVRPSLQAGPTFLQKAKNFAAAAVQHVAAGAPMASDEEVARRFSICQGCEFYDGKACMKCGCPIVRESKFISKLSWADQSCPVGKW